MKFRTRGLTTSSNVSISDLAINIFDLSSNYFRGSIKFSFCCVLLLSLSTVLLLMKLRSNQLYRDPPQQFKKYFYHFVVMETDVLFSKFTRKIVRLFRVLVYNQNYFKNFKPNKQGVTSIFFTKNSTVISDVILWSWAWIDVDPFKGIFPFLAAIIFFCSGSVFPVLGRVCRLKD